MMGMPTRIAFTGSNLRAGDKVRWVWVNETDMAVGMFNVDDCETKEHTTATATVIEERIDSTGDVRAHDTTPHACESRGHDWTMTST